MWSLAFAQLTWAFTQPIPRMRLTPRAMVDLSTFDLAAISGTTCINEGGAWCSTQNTFQSLIVGLHGVVVQAGVKENAYGLTIILFTLFCRTITFPLNYVSYQSTDRVKALKPYLDKIRDRYKDQKAVNLASAKLYEMTNTNPIAGCLPSIAQIPVFIFLYRSVLNLAFEDQINEPFFWLPSLEGPTFDKGRGIQWLTEWVDGVPPLGWHDTLCFMALPMALVVTQSISMRVLAPPTDPNDEGAQRAQRFLKYLPLLIGFFSAQTPSGLGLYWMTSNVFSVVSSYAAKSYLAANPPSLDVDLVELGIDDESAGIKLPNTIEEAIAQAKINARPLRTPRRPGVPPIDAFTAVLLTTPIHLQAVGHSLGVTSSSSSGDDDDGDNTNNDLVAAPTKIEETDRVAAR